MENLMSLVPNENHAKKKKMANCRRFRVKERSVIQKTKKSKKRATSVVACVLVTRSLARSDRELLPKMTQKVMVPNENHAKKKMAYCLRFWVKERSVIQKTEKSRNVLPLS